MVRSPPRSAHRAGARPVAASLSLLTAFATAPATATTVGAVIEVTAPSDAGQRAPAVAWEPDPALPGGGVYVLVWEDDRNDDGTPTGPGRDLYGARVRPDGTQVDTGGVNLLEATARPGNQSQPSIVFAGTAAPPVHLISWTDPRNAINDIYAARLISSTMSTIPSGGFQVTSSVNDTDAFSSAAFGGATYLVAYQTNVAQGPQLVQAQRLFTDTTLDGSPIRLFAGTQALNPVVLGQGANYVYGFETGSGRARVGQFSTTSSPGTLTSTAVSTSTIGQSRLRLATIGQDVFAVWQDVRGADRDIYASVLDPSTLRPRTADVVVSAARNDQLNPDVAGDAAGGLVVWQDRRNTTANAEIYGARVDAATGGIRDPRGFPVFSFSGNGFEPAVAKGPGSDYLVTAIRFGSPTRLFYRVVRDEDPAGTMTASGRLVVPADGVRTATVGFGRAQGASGFAVANGTLYDVTLSSANPVIVEPDADPQRAGHQIEANDGRVLVSLRSTAREMVTVSVASVEGTSTGSAMLEFQNVAPVVSDVRVTPSEPRSVDDLQLGYTYFDVNGDPEMGTEIVWLRDNGTQPAFNDQTTVPASATTRGEVWRAFVQPGDGLVVNPTRTFSSSVTIGNTPPEIVDAAVVRDNDPTLPPRTGDRIVLRYRFRDADLDSEGPTRIRWFDRGQPVPELDGATAIEGERVVKGQVWSATLLPNDGFVDGALVTTATLTVVNTAPVANAGPDASVLERRTLTLDGTMSSDVDPQDELQYAWTQVVGRPVELDDPTSPTPSFTAPSVPATTTVQFDLVVSDGEEQSTNVDRVAVDIDAVTDSDRDGLDDEEEADEGTDPNASDTDQDQLSDAVEVANGLDPLDQDADDDGLRDGQEGLPCRASGCEAAPFEDADGDGVVNALDPDADDDGLPDGLELGFATPLPPRTLGEFAVGGTDEAAGRFVADQDVTTVTDPTDADSDDDGLSDGAEDANGNGRVDPGESDPNDVLDPGISCTDSGDCPAGLGCVDGLCAEGPLTCDPLPEDIECCEGSCSPEGVLVEAVCVEGAARARCPIGSEQCAIRPGRSCGLEWMPPEEPSGCRCLGAPGRRPVGFGLGLALLGGLVLLRRRPGGRRSGRAGTRGAQRRSARST